MPQTGTAACSPADLIEASRCFACIPDGMQMQVIIYLLNEQLPAPLTVKELLAAAPCGECIPDGLKPQVISYLLCRQLENQ